LVLQILFWISIGFSHEKSVGTVRYFLYFFVTNFAISLLFDLIMIIFSIGNVKYRENQIYGLLPFILTEIILETYRDPDAIIQYFT